MSLLNPGVSGGGSGGTSSSFSSSFPSSGTAVGASDGTNMQPLLVDGSGYLEVNVKAGSGSGLSVVDEAGWSAGVSNFVPTGGVFNDTATALTSGQQGTQRYTANRAAHTNLRDHSGNELLGQQLAASSIPVILPSATITTLTPPSNTGYALDSSLSIIDTDLKSNIILHAGTNLIGKVGIDQTTLGTTNNVSISGTTGAGTSTLLKDDTSFGDGVTTGILSVTNRLWNGTNYDRAYGDKTNGAFVNVKTSVLPTGAALETGGNLATLAGGVTSSKYQTNVAQIAGSTTSTAATGVQKVGIVGNAGAAVDAATNAAPPANAVQVGGIASTALPSAFTATDLAPILLDKFGRVVTSPFTVRDLLGDQTTSITSTTAATTIVTADASNMLDLISLTLTNTSATATEVSLYNDDGTTLRWTGYVPAGDMRGIVFPAPLKQTAVNKTWKMITVTSVASLKVTAQFVKNQ
jgi:hypothetical protein